MSGGGGIGVVDDEGETSEKDRERRRAIARRLPSVSVPTSRVFGFCLNKLDDRLLSIVLELDDDDGDDTTVAAVSLTVVVVVVFLVVSFKVVSIISSEKRSSLLIIFTDITA